MARAVDLGPIRAAYAEDPGSVTAATDDSGAAGSDASRAGSADSADGAGGADAAGADSDADGGISATRAAPCG